ncbi:hypothetical protein AM493_01385 [Flavobacterium akiainvivens]|uniref:histidine kinase n=1 Tax=Flavobacterium akiainvivens TaxID=1202724 RepID=A0A0M8MAW8_9FLAO|nr:histidine kinase dimerization/phosphoacceptor domain -containing protein [Flavobacterium akiainvivens]KOS04844.1 hypothetical protein AM493_01385 [Flavobacterium akiainvivens]SFQ43373.1 Two-component sensor histidine kinase, contains HisKA and HATPase domains [Flavobacterium akiainvivens]
MKTILLMLAIFTGLVVHGQPKPWKELNRNVSQPGNGIAKVKAYQAMGQFFAAKPKSVEVHLDSAYYFTDKALRLSKTLTYYEGEGMACVLLSRIWRERHEFDKAKVCNNKALAIARSKKLVALEGEYWCEFSYYFGWGKEQMDRIRYLEKALVFFRKANSKTQLMEVLASLAEQYTNISEHRKAITIASESLRMCRDAGRADLLQNLYDLLGICYTKMGLYEQGIKYSLAAAKEGDKKNDTSIQMASIYNNLGLAHYYNRNYTDAERFHLKALELAVANKDDNYTHVVINNVVNDLVHGGNAKRAERFLQEKLKQHKAENPDDRIMDKLSLITVYGALQKNSKANNETLTLIALAQEHKPALRQSVIYNVNATAIRYFFNRKEVSKAQQYLDKNKEIARITEDQFYQRNNTFWDFKIDSLTGNYEQAFKKYKTYSDRTRRAAKQDQDNQIALLQVEYDAEQKSNDIKQKERNIQLLNRDARLRNAQLENDKTIKIVIYTVFGLVLIIAALLLYSFYMKRKSVRQLEIKQAIIEHKNVSLENMAEEKEWLLREIHHRVKNNLQIVMSLLNSQSAFLTDAAAIAALKNSQQRVNAMSLIHQRLYTNENMSSINVRDYVTEMIEYLKESYQVSRNIRFVTHIEDVTLDIGPAVPVGLILNEVLTNAIRHAFPSGTGTVTIEVFINSNENFVLRVTDDGKGLDQAIEWESTGTLGMRLIKGLSKELDASLDFTSNSTGTVTRLEFAIKYTAVEDLT